MSNKMFCPVCKKEGLKSYLYPGITTSTLVGYLPFYDKEGKYHDHDDNFNTTEYRCSNNHEFSYRHPNKCWCGWEGKKEEYYIRPNTIMTDGQSHIK